MNNLGGPDIHIPCNAFGGVTGQEIARENGESSAACIVQSKFSASNSVAETAEDDKELPVTTVQYGTLQDAYDYFNRSLFEGKLPYVLITLQRHPGARGFFSPEEFRRRDEADVRVHEVALNPDSFHSRTDQEILSTLAHEMVHVWQQEFGKPGRGRYHNREWARKMHSIGLMPSSTGKPGGAMTGDCVSHYILESGPFASTCREFLRRYKLVWESACDPAEVTAGSRPRRPKTQTRAKFTCPICGLNMWGKPGACTCCGDCSKETGELIVMIADDGSGDPAATNTLSNLAGGRDPYDRAFALLTEAGQRAGRLKIPKQDFLPALVDFVTATALIVDCEAGLRAFMARMEKRLDEWRSGTLPARDPAADESAG